MRDYLTISPRTPSLIVRTVYRCRDATQNSLGFPNLICSGSRLFAFDSFLLLREWEDITPLARNEWICWTQSVKTPEIRQEHVERAVADLKGGKRRPCCWM